MNIESTRYKGNSTLASRPITALMKVLVTAIVGLVVILFVGCASRTEGTSQPLGSTSPIPAVVASPVPTSTAVSPASPWMDIMVAQTRHFIGDPGAPVTIIEFGDFQ